jgi:hypothetical protein
MIEYGISCRSCMPAVGIYGDGHPLHPTDQHDAIGNALLQLKKGRCRRSQTVLNWKAIKMPEPDRAVPLSIERKLRTVGLALCLAPLPSHAAAASDALWQPSMIAADWDIRFSPGMPEHPTQKGKGWQFSFPRYEGELPCLDHLRPACPSVHYLTTRAEGPLRGESISVTIEIIGAATFRYRLEPENTCDNPATVRLLIQRRGDDFTREFYRWWSNPLAIELAEGKKTINVPLAPDQWSSVFGKKGDVAEREFRAALVDIGNIGFTFGGGCFFGHGVNASRGESIFTLSEILIHR